jgi:pimeloyl-ACP methyl ester carboxylesterase
LFLAGSRANYITPELHDQIYQMFPLAEIKYLDAGHWVHSEKPKQVVDYVTEYLHLK